MAVLRIAMKSIKLFFRNFTLIPILIGMPVFQIYLLAKIMQDAIPAGAGDQPFVELILLQTTESIDPAQFFAASILVIFLLITGMIAAMSMMEERETYVLTRVFAAPLTKAEIIGGNLVGQIPTTLVFAAAIIAVTHVFLGINWGSAWGHLLLVTLALIFVALSIGYVFVGVLKDYKTAGGAMSFLVIVMGFLSDGLTGGAITGSGTFSWVSNFTINKWAYEAYIAVMQGQPFSYYAPNLLVLVGIGTVCTFIAIIVFRRESIYE